MYIRTYDTWFSTYVCTYVCACMHAHFITLHMYTTQPAYARRTQWTPPIPDTLGPEKTVLNIEDVLIAGVEGIQ